MVDNNPLVVGAAAILIISATLAPLFPMFMSMSLLSCAAFYMGTSQKQSSARPETMMYVAACLAMLDYILESVFLGPARKQAREEKKLAESGRSAAAAATWEAGEEDEIEDPLGISQWADIQLGRLAG